MSDVECPYCGDEQEINHDDGYGYEEDKTHEQECGSCEKTFAYTTCISFDYTASKADCLNGSPHQLIPAIGYQYHYPDAKHCRDCGFLDRGQPRHQPQGGQL